MSKMCVRKCVIRTPISCSQSVGVSQIQVHICVMLYRIETNSTSSNCLPPGVSSTRLPNWLFLPDFDEHTRLRLRPDILIIEGLSLSTFLHHQSDLESLTPYGLTLLTDIKKHAKIHIIELGFTSDTSHTDSLTRKRLQHNHLASPLLSAGWTLATSIHPPLSNNTPLLHELSPYTDTTIATSPIIHDIVQPDQDPPLPAQHPHNIPDLSRHIHIILLSSSGVVYKPTDTILSMLGLSATDIDQLLRSLHKISISSLHTIIKLRRKLERQLTPNGTTLPHCRIHMPSAVLLPSSRSDAHCPVPPEPP